MMKEYLEGLVKEAEAKVDERARLRNIPMNELLKAAGIGKVADLKVHIGGKALKATGITSFLKKHKLVDTAAGKATKKRVQRYGGGGSAQRIRDSDLAARTEKMTGATGRGVAAVAATSAAAGAGAVKLHDKLKDKKAAMSKCSKCNKTMHLEDTKDGGLETCACGNTGNLKLAGSAPVTKNPTTGGPEPTAYGQQSSVGGKDHEASAKIAKQAGTILAKNLLKDLAEEKTDTGEHEEKTSAVRILEKMRDRSGSEPGYEVMNKDEVEKQAKYDIEDVRESIQETKGREDVPGMKKRWGIGGGIAGGLAGMGIGGALGALTKKRGVGMLAAPILGAAGAAGGAALGAQQGEEEAKANKLVSWLRMRRAHAAGARKGLQKGYMLALLTGSPQTMGGGQPLGGEPPFVQGR